MAKMSKLLRQAIEKEGSPLERAFDTQFRAMAPDLPRPEKDYRFDLTRRWRFDRAWPTFKVAVELEGGAFGNRVVCHRCGAVVRAATRDGRLGQEVRSAGWHGHYGRFVSDREKYNAAEVQGWLVLRFVNEDVMTQPYSMLESIRQALENRAYAVRGVERLTPTQDKVMHLVAAGLRTPEIAERLQMPESSVRKHAERACSRVNTNNRTSAVARMLVWNLLDPNRIPWAMDRGCYLGVTGTPSAFALGGMEA
jgi:DNA-binding CsgD family transcriptional regulator